MKTFQNLNNGFKIIIFTFFFISINSYAEDYFWVGNSGNWSDFANHWSVSSGGSSMHSSVPGIDDNVFFDQNSFNVLSSVVLDLSIMQCKSFDCSTITSPSNIIGASSSVLEVYGDWNSSPLISNAFLGQITFASGSSSFIKSEGIPFQGQINFDGIGSWELKDNFNTLGKLKIIKGSLATGDAAQLLSGSFNVTCLGLFINGVKPRTLKAGTSTFTITGADTAFIFSPVNLFLYEELATFKFTNIGVDTVRYFSSGVTDTITNLNIASSTILFEDESAFKNIVSVPGSGIFIKEKKTLSTNSLSIDGTCSLVSVLSSSSSDTALLKVVGGATINYNSIKGINAVSGSYVANNSFDNGANKGWVINEIASNGYVYWTANGANDNWSNPDNWSTNCIPGPNDTVVFNSASFTTNNQIVNLDIDGYAYAVRWEGTTNNPEFSGSDYSLRLKNELTIDVPIVSSFSGNILLTGLGNGTIKTSGVVQNSELSFENSCDWIFLDGYNSNEGIEINEGSLDFGAFSHSIDHLLSTSTSSRVINLNSAVIELKGTENTIEFESTGLTLNTTSSTLNLTNTNNSLFSRLISNAVSYDTIVVANLSTHIYGSNTFKCIKVNAGSELLLEGGEVQNIDSLISFGTCANMVRLGTINSGGLSAQILKTGFDTLRLDFVELNHLDAVTFPNFSYELTNSFVHNSALNWTEIGSSIGTRFYWRTDQGNWGDVGNWESPLGVPATCLPTIKDTVYFDANSFTLQNQIVTIDVPASAKIISWNGSGSFKPVLHFYKSLNIRKDMIIDPEISFTSSGPYPEMKFIPDGENGSFVTNEISIDVNITVDGKISSDAIALSGDLKMSNDNSLKVIGGAFQTTGDSVFVGELNLNATSTQVDLGTTVFSIFEKIDMRGTGIIDLMNSKIHFAKDCNSSTIYGTSRSFNYLKIYGNSSSITTFNGTNSIESFEIEKGSRVQFEESNELTINNSFLANGACESDTIYLSSTIAGTPTNINCANALSPTLEVCNVSDINASGNPIIILFGNNSGGNTNVSFSATKSSTPSFTRTFHNCFGSAVDFNNTSVDYLSGNNLTYLWDFGDESSSTDPVPNHTYNSDGTYFIELTSYYVNGCYETYYDSVRVNDPSIVLSSTESDTAICIGDEVSFSVSSPGASNFEFYLNTNSVQNGIDTSYVTSSLLNEDSIRVLVTLNGCTKMSDALPFTVNLYPIVTLLSSDLDDVICDGDSVILSATGASNYLFAIDGIDVGYFDVDSIYKTNSISDGQIISVQGKDTLTGCYLTSPASYQFTVNENPIPLVSSSDNDLVICQGDLVTFTASGASEFEFFIDGVSFQSLSSNAIFNTSSLLNGQTVTTAGTTLGCTTLSADSTSWFVNPLPPVIISNNTLNNNICEGEEVEFSVVGASFYEFFNNGVSVQGPSGSNSFSINSLSNGDVISVTGTQSGCIKNVQSPPISVTLLPVVDLVSSDADNSICSDELVVFTASGASNYSFYIDGILATGNSNSFIYSTDSILNGQTITVSGESGGCSDFSLSSFNFIVEPPINLNFSMVSNVDTICEGTNVLFSSYGFGVSQYDIEVNTINYGTSLNGDFDIILPVGLNVVKLIGTKNGCQKYADNEFQIYVNPLPNVSFTSSDSDNIICDDDSVVFDANGALFYEFFVDGFSQGAPSIYDSIVLNGILNGQTVSVQGVSNGCVGTSSTTFNFLVNDSPDLILSSDDVDGVICEGSPILFTTSGAIQYQYNVNGVNVSGFTSLNTYLTDSLVDGEVVFVEGVSNGCYSLDSITITVNSLPNPRMILNDADTTSCAGDLISIQANGASLYEFFVDNISQGLPAINPIFSSNSLMDGQLITLKGTSNSGCVANSIDTISYTILPLPSISVSVNALSNNLCSGDLVAFSTIGPDSINYYLNGLFLTNSANYSSDSILNGDVITINGYSNGCFVSADSTYQFTVYNYPITSIQTTDLDTIICAGDLIDFIGYGALEYEFFVDGISQGLSTNDTLSSSNITNGQTVNVVGYNNGCAATSSDIAVLVNDYPLSVLTSSDLNDTICYGELVTFVASGASYYEFYNNSILLNSFGNSSIVVNDIESGDTLYTVGYNGDCSDVSNEFVFHVYKMDLEIQSSTNNMICDGESIEFQCSGADQYEFFIDGNSVQSMSTNNLFSASNMLNGQILSFKGLNNFTGCIQDSDNQQLIVVLNNPSISPVGPISLCEGDSVILLSNYSSLNQWFIDSNEITGAIYDSYVVYNTGNYQTGITLGGNYEMESVGNNTYGQLGNDNFISSVVSQDVVNLSGVGQINSGKYFNVALDTLGDLYCWGKNDFGQLGDTTYGSKNEPVFIMNKVSSSDAGDRFTVISKNNGNVMTWGENNAGQLGIGNSIATNYPSLISGISNIIDVKAGASHVLALDNAGNVYSWGSNQYGQLGTGNLNSTNIPILCNISGIAKIGIGSNHSFAIDSNGTLWAWGDNQYGQLGIGNFNFQTLPVQLNLRNITVVDGGENHSVAVSTNGALYCWGANFNGQLGDSSNTDVSDPLLISSIGSVINAEAGFNNTFVNRQDNSVWSFGRNTNYQLADETNVDKNHPTHISKSTGATDFGLGYSHSSILASSETSCVSNEVIVDVLPAPTVIIIVVDTFFFASETGISYQWYLNGNPILINGNSQSIVPYATGYYNVEVTYSNGCVIASNDYPYNIVNIQEFNLNNQFKVFPNPSNGIFNVNKNVLHPVQITVFNQLGQQVYESALINRSTELNLNFLSSGMYLIKLSDVKSSSLIKIEIF